MPVYVFTLGVCPRLGLGFYNFDITKSAGRVTLEIAHVRERLVEWRARYPAGLWFMEPGRPPFVGISRGVCMTWVWVQLPCVRTFAARGFFLHVDKNIFSAGNFFAHTLVTPCENFSDRVIFFYTLTKIFSQPEIFFAHMPHVLSSSPRPYQF